MKRSKSKKYFLLLVIISAAIFLLGSFGIFNRLRGGAEKLISPLQGEVYSTWQKTESGVNFLTFWKNGTNKIKNLEERNRELTVKAVKADFLEKENKILREQLKVEKEPDKKKILAKVIGLKGKLKIDKGSNDGIKKNMAVYFNNFLVGKIVELNPSSSIVELPTDSKSKISVITEQTKAKGILLGQFNNGLSLDSVLQEEELRLGDQVLTSGEEGNLPSDLIVGRITKVEKKESSLFQRATVEPSIDYSSLKVVFLIKD